MSDDQDKRTSALSIEGLRRIDQTCIEFETAWTRGDSPRLETYLEDLHGTERDCLFCELLLLDLDYRRKRGEKPERRDYEQRFPGDQKLVRRVFDGAFSRPATPHQGDPPLGTPLHYFGDYELLEEIARGGMGVVYKARQMSLNRTVALKMILAGQLASEKDVHRFHREAEAAAALNHPGIVPIYEIGEYDGQHYFSMAYVDGPSLADRLAEGPLPPGEAVQLMTLVCQAVGYAHQHGVIHRDLKPANILLGPDGKPHVTDFGLAKRTEGPAGTSTTCRVVGTPAYMSPEQAAGNTDQVQMASDVYSLGAVLYATFTGRPPLQAHSVVDTLQMVMEQDPVPPRQWNSRVPLDLETICLKCLEKRPPRRYATATELADDLQRFLDGQPVFARPPSFAYRFYKFARRHRTGLGVSALIVAALLLAVLGTAWQAVRAARAERAALRGWNRAETLRKRASEAEQTAQTAATRAELEAERAASQAAISQAVIDFLDHDLLARASPFHEPNRDIRLRTVVDRAAEAVPHRFRDQPLVEAAIRQTLGVTYAPLGEYEKAQRHVERAREIYARESGPNDPSTLNSENSLGIILHLRGQLEKAREVFDQVLAARRLALGEEHNDTLDTMNNLALVYQDQGHYEEARHLLRQVLEIRRRVQGPNATHTLKAMHNLANVEVDMGNFAEAEKLDLEVLEIRRRVLRTNHPDTLKSMHNLALLLARQHRFPEAEKLLSHVNSVRREILGKEHPDTLTSLANLASLAWQQRRWKEAEERYAQTLAIQRRVLPPDDPDILTSMQGLALVYQSEARWKDAEDLYQQVIQSSARVRGPEHPKTLNSMHNLAVVYAQLGRSSEAECLDRQVLSIRRRVLPPGHPDTLKTMNNLATVLRDQRRFDDAEKLYREVFETRLRSLGPKARETLAVRQNLGNLCLLRGQFAAAEQEFSEIVAVRRQVFGPDDIDTLLSMVNLALAYNGRGRYRDAITTLTEVIEVNPKLVGATNSLAWLLCTCHDQDLRDPPRAVQLAERNVVQVPGDPSSWFTLGLARYRTGDFTGALYAFQKPTQNGHCTGGDVWLLLAMTHRQLGHVDEALKWYRMANAWLDHHPTRDRVIVALRAEAKELFTSKNDQTTTTTQPSQRENPVPPDRT